MPSQPYTRQRAQHRRQREAGDDVAQRARGVLHAAHPAVARRRDQDRRHPEDRDPDPRQRLVGDVTACGQRRHQRHRGGLDHDDDQRAETQRQPGGLHALRRRPRRGCPAPKNRAERAVVPYDRNVICELSVLRISPPIASPPEPARPVGRRRRCRTADRSALRPAPRVRAAPVRRCVDRWRGDRPSHPPVQARAVIERLYDVVGGPGRRVTGGQAVPAAAEGAGDGGQVVGLRAHRHRPVPGLDLLEHRGHLGLLRWCARCRRCSRLPPGARSPIPGVPQRHTPDRGHRRRRGAAAPTRAHATASAATRTGGCPAACG